LLLAIDRFPRVSLERGFFRLGNDDTRDRTIARYGDYVNAELRADVRVNANGELIDAYPSGDYVFAP